MNLLLRKQPPGAKSPSGCRLLSIAVALYLTLPSSAWSGDLCSGKYRDTAMGPWPANVAFSVPLETVGAAGQTRASVFRAGLQQSGIRIDDKSPIRLQLIVSLASSGNEEVVSSGVDWNRVDTALSTSLKDPALPGSSLSVTAVVSDDDQRRNIWAATVNCIVHTDDSEALARELGVDLGRLLSESIRSGH